MKVLFCTFLFSLSFSMAKGEFVYCLWCFDIRVHVSVSPRQLPGFLTLGVQYILIFDLCFVFVFGVFLVFFWCFFFFCNLYNTCKYLAQTVYKVLKGGGERAQGMTFSGKFTEWIKFEHSKNLTFPSARTEHVSTSIFSCRQYIYISLACFVAQLIWIKNVLLFFCKQTEKTERNVNVDV